MANVLDTSFTFDGLNPRVNFALDQGINVMLVGKPGIGKSEWAKGIAKERGADLLLIAPYLKNPTHFTGLAFNDKGQATFLPYDFMRKIFDAKSELVVVIDDALLASNLLQAAVMNLIQERSIDGRQIPDCVKFIITTNDAGQNAGGNSIISPFNNRTIILPFPEDANGWLKWGLESGRICREVLLYIHANKSDLFVDRVPKGIKAFPSPRSWENVSKFVAGGFTDAPTIAGLVGPEIACRCAAFIKDLAEFGNLLPKVLSDPDTAPMLSGLSKIYGAVLILSNNFEKANVDKIVRYFQRYQNEELLQVLFNLGTMTHPDSKETKAYATHATQV